MEDKGSRENKSPACARKQQGLLERKREITAPQEAVAKFLLPSLGPGLCPTLFMKVLHTFPSGLRSFGGEGACQWSWSKRKERNGIQYREIGGACLNSSEGRKGFFLFSGIWQRSRALSARYITRLIKLPCSMLSRWFCG